MRKHMKTQRCLLENTKKEFYCNGTSYFGIKTLKEKYNGLKK